jgi:tRNA G18 (ribose-2'-O)-methylase SpoU/DNA-binding XRE family transcriptional regulator
MAANRHPRSGGAPARSARDLGQVPAQGARAFCQGAAVKRATLARLVSMSCVIRRSFSKEQLRARKPDRRVFRDLPRAPFSIVIDNLTSGFNVGSIFRTADAFLAERVYLCGTTPTPPRARITKTSMGTDRWVPWERSASARDVVDGLRERGTQIVAVELTDGSIPPDGADLRPPLALVLGDELAGVSAPVLEAADLAVAVPMLGMGNSMNVSAAFAIVAYELTRSLRLSVDPDRASEQVRLMRVHRGLSMRELANLAGIHFTTISDIENGHRRPSPSTLRKLSCVLASAHARVDSA